MQCTEKRRAKQPTRNHHFKRKALRSMKAVIRFWFRNDFLYPLCQVSFLSASTDGTRNLVATPTGFGTRRNKEMYPLSERKATCLPKLQNTTYPFLWNVTALFTIERGWQTWLEYLRMHVLSIWFHLCHQSVAYKKSLPYSSVAMTWNLSV